MRAAFLALLFMTAVAASADAQQAAPASANDPYIWLEDVSGQRSMDWVNSHNAKTTSVLEADPRYQQYYNEALAIAQAKDRIPYGSFTGGQIYNFWQDEDHVRGILRRTTRASYESGQPEWTTVLDLDALAKAENANWVFK
jgi:prolyl oligopeptidase